MGTQWLLCLVLQTWMQNWSRGALEEETVLAKQTQWAATVFPRALAWNCCSEHRSVWEQGWWELLREPHRWAKKWPCRGLEFRPSCTVPSAGRSDTAPAAQLFCGVMPNFLCPCVYWEGDSSSKVFHSNPLSKEWHECVAWGQVSCAHTWKSWVTFSLLKAWCV